MDLKRVTEEDYAGVVELANAAFRGTDSVEGWSTEIGYIEGPRLTEALLREDLAAKPEALLLLWRDRDDDTLLGTVWLEPGTEGMWYLGLLTVRPAMQNRQLGRTLLAAAEDHARGLGATTMRMTVVNVREALIAWYERRGYAKTGEVKPFPYGDDRFGRPLRDDLEFVVLEKKLAASS